MDRILLGISGLPGTGKTTAGSYLVQKYGFVYYEGSDLIRSHARDAGIILKTRIELNEYHKKMQESLGLACLTDTFLTMPGDRKIQGGLRAWPNFKQLKNNGGYVLGLVCAPQICLDRMDKTDPKNPHTIEEYLEAINIESSVSKNGVHTIKCVENADFKLDTSGSLEDTYKRLDEIMRQIYS